MSNKLQMKLVDGFIYSACLLLALTGLAKAISAFGHAHLLHLLAPFLPMTFQVLFLLAGAVELIVAIVCLINKDRALSTLLIAWLSTNFIIYRTGLSLIHYSEPCPCLGSLTGALHISTQTSDIIMNVIALYLLCGSYASLLWLWRQRNVFCGNNEPAHHK